MALDGIYLNLLKHELEQTLVGGKVDKIYQTQKVELVFNIRVRTGAYKLLVSASGNSPRLHLTESKIENPANPPMLCMLLRKQLSGATLMGIEQVGFDRILKLVFSASNELGDKVTRTLVVEIMAQYSNIILLDENEMIIDSVRRVDASKSSVRQILPKIKYILPPGQDKMDILIDDTDKIISAVKEKNSRLANALLSCIQGMSPVLSREIAFRAAGIDAFSGELTPLQTDKLRFEIEVLKNTVKNHTVSPTAVINSDGKMLDFSFIPITQYGKTAEYKSFDSLSGLLEGFYFERERLVRTKSKAQDLFKTVNNLIERTAKKINNRITELEACKEKDEKKVYAELISANIYRLNKGVSEYEVENYYDNNKVISIPVKPELTPSENSQRYYREYRKLRTAEDMLVTLISEGQDDLAYMTTVLDELNRAETEKEISEIRTELSEGGYIKRKNQGKLKKQQPMKPLEFDAPDGFKIYVGRNNFQNDRLSLKNAAKNDFWFHIQKAPGSHVILAAQGREPTERAMEFAAETAAYYSSGREAGYVEVDYTRAGNLKKPTGAKPGFVIYHVYNSIQVKPIKPE